MGAESKILFKAFLRRHNNKDVVPTLLAMQKMTAFYHNKGIDMLKLGCTLANLTIICLQKSTRPKFYPFTEGDKELLQKIGEDVVVGPSIVFTPRMSLIKISLGVCILCANQLLVLMRVNCFSTQGVNLWQQDFTHVGILPQWSTYLYRHRKKTRSFEILVMSYFQRMGRVWEIEDLYTTGRQKEIDCFIVDEFFSHSRTVFEAMGCFYHFAFSRNTALSHRRRYPTQYWKERTRRDEIELFERRRLHCHWNVGVWVGETVRNRH